jgi:hypothetical protein
MVAPVSVNSAASTPANAAVADDSAYENDLQSFRSGFPARHEPDRVGTFLPQPDFTAYCQSLMSASAKTVMRRNRNRNN